MENTDFKQIDSIIDAQKAFFATGQTRRIDYRKAQLKLLLEALAAYEKRISDALWADLHKSYQESYLTEISLVRGEIDSHIRHLKSWARRERRSTPITIFGFSRHWSSRSSPKAGRTATMSAVTDGFSYFPRVARYAAIFFMSSAVGFILSLFHIAVLT